VLLHPGSIGQYAILRWTAPAPGDYAIRVGFAGVDFSFPTSTDVAVLRNGVPLMTGQVTTFDGPAQCASSAYTPSATHDQILALAAGETIDAVVGYGANQTFNGDSTLVDMSVVVAGNAQILGTSCGFATTLLSVTRPVLGGPTTLAISSGPPTTVGTLYVSAPATPVNFGPGCTVFVNTTLMIPFVGLATDAFGEWSQTLVIPAVPGVSGARLIVQGLLFPAPTPLGYVITNGLDVTL
jgi:hypothetical protein